MALKRQQEVTVDSTADLDITELFNVLTTNSKVSCAQTLDIIIHYVYNELYINMFIYCILKYPVLSVSVNDKYKSSSQADLNSIQLIDIAPNTLQCKV